MPTIIPPIPTVERGAEEYAALRNLLRKSGWDETSVCERLSIPTLAGVKPEVVRRDDSGPLGRASDALTKLYIEGWPVDRAVLDTLLTPEGVALLESFALLMPHGDAGLAGTVSLYPIEQLFIASDRYNNADGSLYEGWDDLVYPCLFSTTRKFIEMLPRTPCGDVLDLCAGTGVGALLLAGQAQNLLATDLTPRCDSFMQFNARLNGYSNVETGTGDLYAPANGRQYDRIIVHPPYQPVMEHIATFNSGGADGEQITRRIIEGAPAHLKPGGRLYCLCQLTDREYPVEARIRGWLTEAESAQCDVAFVCYKHHDVTRYTAIETLQERKSHAAWQAWMKALGEAGVRDMVYGMVVVQKKASPLRANFTVRREGPLSSRTDLLALLDGETAASEMEFGERIANLRVRATPGTSMRVTHNLEAGQWKQDRLQLLRAAPFEVAVEVDPVTANLLSMMNGTKTCGELRTSLPFEVPAAQFGNLVRMLISNRIVELE